MLDLSLNRPSTQDLKMFEFYKNNPALACIDLLKQDLAPFQRVVINGVVQHPYSMNILSRGSGKTRMIAMIGAILAMFNPKMKIGFLGPQFRCQEGETTYSFTDEGMLNGFELSIKPKIFSLLSENQIEEFAINKEELGLEVWTEKGFYIAGKNDHKILVLNNKTFETYYKNLIDLTEEDNVLIKNNINYWNTKEEEYLGLIGNFQSESKKYNLDLNNIDENVFYGLGAITGDGFIDEKNKSRVSLGGIDKEIIDRFKKMVNNLMVPNFGSLNITESGIAYTIHSEGLVGWLKYLGFKPNCGAQGKEIPLLVRKAPKKYVSAFLQGLFDTDGTVQLLKNKTAKVKLTTSSFVLANQVHTLLLNYGIVSSLYKWDGRGEIEIQGFKTFGRDYYDIVIGDKDSVLKFYQEIGFGLTRKNKKLEEYSKLEFSSKNTNNIFENLGSILKGLAEKYGVSNYRINQLCNNSSIETGMFWVRKFREVYGINDEILDNIEYIYNLNLFSVKVKSKKEKNVVTVATQVANEHCFNGNGFINHNTAKLAFAELETLIGESAQLESSLAKSPSKLADMWRCDFKNGASIFALPLAADSAMSIRGTRLHMALIDEYPHVPVDVIERVINPMLATQLNPMKNVRRIQEEKRLLKEGLITEKDLKKSEKNRIAGFSSAYFKFNHMYKTIESYKDASRKELKDLGKTDYRVNIFNYLDGPEGFFDMSMIEHSKRTSSELTFAMEYLSEFPDDSYGFYKRSLIESCKSRGLFYFEARGEKGPRYILGIDPARTSDNFSIAIIKIVDGQMRLTRVISFADTPFPILADYIRALLDSYDVEMIAMDAGGGGLTMKDLLADPMTTMDKSKIILDFEDDTTTAREGRRILKMIDFSSKWISDANFDMRSSMEHKRLVFPDINMADTYLAPEADVTNVEDTMLDEFVKLIDELQSIVMTATPTGMLHFDTPSRHMRKDRYSALLIAHKVAYDFIKSGYEVQELAEGGFLGHDGKLIGGEEDYEWKETKIIDDIAAAKHAYSHKAIFEGYLVKE